MEEQVDIRKWKQSDAEELAKIANNIKIFNHLRDVFPHPYHLEDAKEWIKNSGKDSMMVSKAIIVNGIVAGAIGVHFFKDVMQKNAEIGFWLGEQYWGKGICTKALKKMTNYTFRHYPVHRIFAEVFSNNPASGRVLEKCGYKKEAILQEAIFKKGAYLDCLIYALLRSNYSVNS